MTGPQSGQQSRNRHLQDALQSRRSPEDLEPCIRVIEVTGIFRCDDRSRPSRAFRYSVIVNDDVSGITIPYKSSIQISASIRRCPTNNPTTTLEMSLIIYKII